MTARHTIHVVLTASLVRYVRDKVIAGYHPIASDGFRKLMEGDDLHKLKADVGLRVG